MGYLFLFAVLVFVQSSNAHRLGSTSSEKSELSSQRKHYYPERKSDEYHKHKPDDYHEHKSDDYHEHKPGPPDYDAGSKYHSDSKEHVPTKYDFYKPLTDHHSHTSVEDNFNSDASYIPHSKRFSKYLSPNESPSFNQKPSDWEEDDSHNEDSKKTEDVPKYGFVSHKDDSNHKPYTSQKTDELPKKSDHEDWTLNHPQPYKHEPKHGSYSHEKSEERKPYEHDDKTHKIHPDEHGHPHRSNTLRYQHWSDKEAGAFPTLNTEKFIEEIDKSKFYHATNEPEKVPKHDWHDEKSSYVPQIEELLKKHSAHEHKPPHKSDGHTPLNTFYGHRSHPIFGPERLAPFLKHYPHIKKSQKGHNLKYFTHYRPEYNFGGHHYGSMYRPLVNMYAELRKDIDIKMRLLKEHEEKMTELQKGHLDKYRSLFKPHFGGMFLNHGFPKHYIRDIEHHPHSETRDEKHHSISPPKQHSEYPYGDYSKEPGLSSHKPEHHSPYEIPHPKHEGSSDTPTHHYHEPKHHSHYEIPHPKHEGTIETPKHHHYEPKHHSHYEIPHPKHEGASDGPKHYHHELKHHSYYEIPHPKHEGTGEESKHSHPERKHYTHYVNPHPKHKNTNEGPKHYYHEPHHYKDE